MSTGKRPMNRRELLRKGALVDYHDPYIPEIRNGGGSPMRSAPLNEETLRAHPVKGREAGAR